MKDKTIWQGVAILALILGTLTVADRLNIAIPGIPSQAGVSSSGGGQTIVLDDGTRAVDVVCYDVTGTADANGINGVIKVARKGVVVKDVLTTTGAYTFDVNQGFRVGDQLSVRCLNNSEDGYYENRKDLTLTATTGAINVPVHNVGEVQATFYTTAGTIPTQSIALAANGVANLKADIDTSSELAFFYRPIIAFKDATVDGGSIVSSELSKITISGGVGDGGVVSCDIYALPGYTKCVQVSQDFVSAGDLKTVPIQLTCGSSDCAGNISYKIVDGVPYGDVGQANINNADSYDTTGATGWILIT